MAFVHSVAPSAFDLHPQLTSIAWFLRQTTYFRLHPKLKAYHTAKMPDIEMPDPEELGGLVTKPFKFVTGSYLDRPQT